MVRVLFSLFLFLSPTLAYGQAQAEDELALLPVEGDYEAQEQAQDCSAIRAVLRNSQADLQGVSEQRQNYKLVVLQRRQELEACATRARLPVSRDPREMALVAEYCPAEYDAWLYAGANYRLVRADDEQGTRDIRALVAHARRRCLPLPEASAEEPASVVN